MAMEKDWTKAAMLSAPAMAKSTAISCSSTYYYNSTPNDRNIEFDPKQNLLGGLQSFERVTAP
jgi:hypothetical protein